MFTCEFCEISKNTFFIKQLWVTASGISVSIFPYLECLIIIGNNSNLTYTAKYLLAFRDASKSLKIHNSLSNYDLKSLHLNEWNISLSRLLRSKALLFCLEIETKINTSSVKRSGGDEIGAVFLELIFMIRLNQSLLVIIHK